jgi:hypothetical protein
MPDSKTELLERLHNVTTAIEGGRYNAELEPFLLEVVQVLQGTADESLSVAAVVGLGAETSICNWLISRDSSRVYEAAGRLGAMATKLGLYAHEAEHDD